MLAFLENEMETDIIKKSNPQFLIYQAFPDHVNRCVGHRYWDTAGPRYVLDERGFAVYSGPFQNWFMSKSISVLWRSKLIRKVLTKRKRLTPGDFDLFAAIVEKSQQVFENRYGGRFYVLLWPGDPNFDSAIIDRLSRRKVAVIQLKNTVPEIIEHPRKYRIRVPYERHPNSLAYGKITDFLVDFIASEE